MDADVPRQEPPTRKPLHPFFTAARVPPTPAGNQKVDEIPTAVEKPEAATGAEDEKSELIADIPEKTSKPGNKRRKTDNDKGDEEDTKKPRPRKKARPSVAGGIADHFKKLSGELPDPPAGASDQPVTHIVGTESPAPTSKQTEAPRTSAEEAGVSSTHLNGHGHLSTQPPTPDNAQLSPQIPSSSSGENVMQPKKLLQLNTKTGTIGSPPRPKQTQPSGGKTASKKKTGTPSLPKRKSKIVTIPYGTDAESRASVGGKINAIINTPKQPSTPSPKPSPRRTKKNTQVPSMARSVAPNGEKKATHSFFLGKVKKPEVTETVEGTNTKKPEPSPARARVKEFSSTPCSPKKPRINPPNLRLPQFGIKNAGLKFPGAKLPAWPAKDMVHVRGGEANPLRTGEITLPLRPRKLKGNSVHVASSETITDCISHTLGIAETARALRNLKNDEFLPPSPELRLPQKHFESGRKLQARIMPELKTFKSPHPLKKSRDGQLVNGIDTNNKLLPPPQLTSLFDSISSGLSAFDKGECETHHWASKYAPMSAVEVLQPGREAFLLRDWLQALTVQSVHKVPADGDKSKVRGRPPNPKKKKRKKLDGFIVSSDDEDNEMYPLSEDEADWTPSGFRGIVRKTVVRSGDLSKGRDGDSVANTLVISGPTGCGKTALVYAVAKELGFEVFEINPCSRRSGKDVMDKIGDMTRNHHVQQHSSTPRLDEQEAEDSVAKDIKSGKQPTMNAFFKLQAGTAKLEKPAQSSPPQSKGVKKDPPRSQRQSLILLEEADILYEEDKQFWNTVTGLIAQSKRPFIVTCNDEMLLPLLNLKLHGIFRLSSPPRDLAVDRLLLIAANEGHALQRQAVESLYDFRCQDLRAATADLQYWCQIGVGDRKGGFEWFYLRWPKGCDLDEEGQVVRAVSEGTYREGMNWLGRDSIVDPKASPGKVEEELMKQAWDFCGLDLGQVQDFESIAPATRDAGAATDTPQSRMQKLDAFDQLADSVSVADLGACSAFAAFKEELLDATLPDPSAKTLEDCVLGRLHLNTPPVAHYHASPLAITTSIKSLAKLVSRAKTEPTRDPSSATDLSPSAEATAINTIRNTFTTPPPGTNIISRTDIALAFDPLAVSDSPNQAVSYLDPSVLDRTFKLINLEVAPYIRSIVASDLAIQKQRLQLSSLVSEGGKSHGSKRMRTTRAALSALEGGSRSTTRRERWFKAEVNPYLVMKTGGKSWAGLWPEEGGSPVRQQMSPPVEASSSPASSSTGSAIDLPERSAEKPVAKKGRGRPRKKVIMDESGDELADR